MAYPDKRKEKREVSPARKLEVYDPARGDAPFHLEELQEATMRTGQRVNYFTILWLNKGSGQWHVDSNRYSFAGPALLFANPYQTTFVEREQPVVGWRLLFHANFFCIETHHQEVGCNGVLFNNIYGAPVLQLNDESASELERLILLMQAELASAGLAHSEILLSYLKVLLIKATRIKLEQQKFLIEERQPSPEILSRLVEMVELHYRQKRRPSDYANLLGISEKALNKIVRAHFGRTLTLLSRERILNHAKWHLLHTRKSVKEVAVETGFADEFYFSRVFKRATGMAPKAFREFETRIRGGSNLSM
jgi:AraC-like DNA-binding protein